MGSSKKEKKQGTGREERKTGRWQRKLRTCLAVLFAVGILTAEPYGMTMVVSAKQPESVTETEELTKEQADRIVGFIIEKISSGGLSDEEAVREAIAEGEEKFQVTLTEEDKENIVRIVNTVNSWDFDAEELAEKAKDLYDEYGADLLQNPEQALKKAAEEGVKGFFKGVGNFCADLGKGVVNFFKEGVDKLFSFF